MATKKFQYQHSTYAVGFSEKQSSQFESHIDDEALNGSILRLPGNQQLLQLDGKQYRVTTVSHGDRIFVHVAGKTFELRRAERQGGAFSGTGDGDDVTGNLVETPMPGKILKLFVDVGQEVEKGNRLFIVEAMKMENEVKAPRGGVIKAVNFAAGDLVSLGEPVVELEP